MKSISKFVASILICCLLVSCSVPAHLVVITVEEPARTEQDIQQWFLYYQDQFEKKDGEVSRPSEGYPQLAFEGYDTAAKEWESNRKSKMTQTIIAVSILFGLVIYLVIDSTKNTGTGDGYNWR